MPSNKSVIETYHTDRNYLVETFVKKGSLLIGKTIQESLLLEKGSLFLSEIIRKKVKIRNFDKDTIIEEGDVLLFS